MFKKATLLAVLIGAVIAGWSSMAAACGGFFCLNDPVDQTGERIVFTVNPDETITTLIEIQYQGSAADFSWILPIPEGIDADALQVPEDGQAVFDELHALTDVQFIAPELPDCAVDELSFMASAESAMDDSEDSDGSVEIFASGEVGPFGFDVIGSGDPDALIDWLRDTGYRVTPEMEPLIDIYVEQEMAFIAMRLLDGETSESIAPIEITYGGTEPMIPLQLTAVAAQPNMPIWVWIFGQDQALSSNFTNMEIATEEITFFPAGGNDYTFLVQQRANALDGQAFITEFAQNTEPGSFGHPWLDAQAEISPHLTRLNTYIDPEEMTADPMFGFDDTLPDVSNVRDATGLEGLYSCERDGDDGFIESIFGGDGDAIDPTDGTGEVVSFTPDQPLEVENEPETDPENSDRSSTEESATPEQLPFADSSSGSTNLVLLLLPVLLLGVILGMLMRRKD